MKTLKFAKKILPYVIAGTMAFSSPFYKMHGQEPKPVPTKPAQEQVSKPSEAGSADTSMTQKKLDALEGAGDFVTRNFKAIWYVLGAISLIGAGWAVLEVRSFKRAQREWAKEAADELAGREEEIPKIDWGSKDLFQRMEICEKTFAAILPRAKKIETHEEFLAILDAKGMSLREFQVLFANTVNKMLSGQGED